MLTKTCFRCAQPKPLEAFYPHKGMADGRLGKCKECTKADVKKNRLDRIEQYTEFDRSRADLPHRVKARAEYARTEAGAAALLRAKAKWAANHPKARMAHGAVAAAIRAGRLERGGCEVCGKANAHAHHEDYDKKLDVNWLCPKHHQEHHRLDRHST